VKPKVIKVNTGQQLKVRFDKVLDFQLKWDFSIIHPTCWGWLSIRQVWCPTVVQSQLETQYLHKHGKPPCWIASRDDPIKRSEWFQIQQYISKPKKEETQCSKTEEAGDKNKIKNRWAVWNNSNGQINLFFSPD
jgi:hypothetical protein